MSAVPPSPLRRSATGRVLVVAHRGLSAEEPENTLRSFRRAAEVGCDLIELDVHLSRDGVPVVIHDETLERTTDGRGLVGDHTLDALRSLDAGRGERIPTLEEVIAWAEGASAALSVEIKQPAPILGLPDYDGIVEKVVDLVRRSSVAARSLIHSFDHIAIRHVREVWPEATTAISYGAGRLVDPLALGRAAAASGIHLWWSGIEPAVIGPAHAAGMHVHAWGMTWPPRREDIEALVRAGVDSLDANDPRVLHGYLGRSTTVR